MEIGRGLHDECPLLIGDPADQGGLTDRRQDAGHAVIRLLRAGDPIAPRGPAVALVNRLARRRVRRERRRHRPSPPFRSKADHRPASQSRMKISRSPRTWPATTRADWALPSFREIAGSKPTAISSSASGGRSGRRLGLCSGSNPGSSLRSAESVASPDAVPIREAPRAARTAQDAPARSSRSRHPLGIVPLGPTAAVGPPAVSGLETAPQCGVDATVC
jgi:hypothetical protein